MRTLHWFRNDLRVQDNPGLSVAAARGEVLPVFIVDSDQPESSKPGAASNAWLHRSLEQLNASLSGGLLTKKGSASALIIQLCEAYQIDAVTWNRGYEPYSIQRDTALKIALKEAGIQVDSFSAALLYEPWDAVKKDGTPYRVYTPFYKHSQANLEIRQITSLTSNQLNLIQLQTDAAIDDLELLPKIGWDQGMMRHWQPGEEGARARLDAFIEQGLKDYRVGRDFPAKASVSRLSPHLHFGEISPHQVSATLSARAPRTDNFEHFTKELIWREFSYHLLYHFPHLPEKNLQPKFDHFPWEDNLVWLDAWQRGKTGYPIVDAGMRELWQTGSMHNRVRMIVASFLVKNLRLHWRHGMQWFWDCLVDADLASNSAGWQWCAGSGADAAPYFRIFNPITQGQRFDPEGEYTLKYLPELKKLPLKYLYDPWNCPPEIADQLDFSLGTDYPQPIVDVKQSREMALMAFTEMKRLATL
ncbi:MAG: cryptochrome/photolyase family protein [Pseudomonadales bacterium]